MTEKERSRTSTKEQAHQPNGSGSSATNLFDQALENYEQALKAGLRVQEETVKWWTSMLNEPAFPNRWQKTAEGFIHEAMPAAQRRWLEDTMQLVEQNSRKSPDLLKKANEVNRSLSLADAQKRIEELWDTSLVLLRSNTVAMTQANTKVLDAWMDFLHRNVETSTAAAK